MQSEEFDRNLRDFSLNLTITLDALHTLAIVLLDNLEIIIHLQSLCEGDKSYQVLQYLSRGKSNEL